MKVIRFMVTVLLLLVLCASCAHSTGSSKMQELYERLCYSQKMLQRANLAGRKMQIFTNARNTNSMMRLFGGNSEPSEQQSFDAFVKQSNIGWLEEIIKGDKRLAFNKIEVVKDDGIEFVSEIYFNVLTTDSETNSVKCLLFKDGYLIRDKYEEESKLRFLQSTCAASSLRTETETLVQEASLLITNFIISANANREIEMRHFIEDEREPLKSFFHDVVSMQRSDNLAFEVSNISLYKNEVQDEIILQSNFSVLYDEKEDVIPLRWHFKCKDSKLKLFNVDNDEMQETMRHNERVEHARIAASKLSLAVNGCETNKIMELFGSDVKSVSASTFSSFLKSHQVCWLNTIMEKSHRLEYRGFNSPCCKDFCEVFFEEFDREGKVLTRRGIIFKNKYFEKGLPECDFLSDK